jgi:hypothetical protein
MINKDKDPVVENSEGESDKDHADDPVTGIGPEDPS